MNPQQIAILRWCAASLSLPDGRSTSGRAGLSDCYKRSCSSPTGVESIRAELP